MNRIVLIIPYFGKLPNTFNVWLQTARNNPEIDFYFFTDISEIKEEKNIRVKDTTLPELKALFEKKLGFGVSLDNAYKLCDYKAMYGYLLQEFISGYEFWGHCDIDLLFGNIRHFVTDDVLNNYDKIYELGHFTLYRNNETINLAFMSDGNYPEYSYKEVVTSPESHYFDEHFGMRLKSRRLNTKTYYGVGGFFDVNSGVLDFNEAVTPHRKAEKFIWQDGCLYLVDYERNKTEIMYAHLQKRKMQVQGHTRAKNLIVVPNKIVCTDEADITYKPGKLKKKLYGLKRKKQHISDFFKRYKVVKSEYKSIFKYYKSRQAFKQRRKDAFKSIKGDKTND